jgi:hypothetical protein
MANKNTPKVCSLQLPANLNNSVCLHRTVSIMPPTRIIGVIPANKRVNLMSLKGQAHQIGVLQYSAREKRLWQRSPRRSAALSSVKSATHEAPGVSNGELESGGLMLSFVAADEAW